MPDPFDSEYASSVVTGTGTTGVTSGTGAPEVRQTGVVTPTSGEAESRALGFEPERYGLGKPKRVVIRGKVARD